MSRLSRLAAATVVALALPAPAGAEQQGAPPGPPATPSVLTAPLPGPPTAAIVRIGGGFVPHERWLWFDEDGTARVRGMLVDGGGRFKSHADFKSVRAVLEDANACAAAKPSNGPSGPSIIGMDRTFYRVDVRCGKTWYAMPTFVRAGSDAPNLAKVVHGLEAIADTLTWAPTDENVALPDTAPLFRFASPTG